MALIPVSNGAVVATNGYAQIIGPIVPAGNDIFIAFAGGAASGPVVTDTRGNVYLQVAANFIAGVVEAALYVCHNNLALGSGDIIYFNTGVNSGGSSGWGIVAAAYWNGPHLSIRAPDTNVIQAAASTTFASTAVQSLSLTTIEREALIIGVMGNAGSGGPLSVGFPPDTASISGIVDIANIATPFVNNGTTISDGGTGSTPTPSGTEGFYDTLFVFEATVEGPIGGASQTFTITPSSASGACFIIASFYTANQFVAPTKIGGQGGIAAVTHIIGFEQATPRGTGLILAAPVVRDIAKVALIGGGTLAPVPATRTTPAIASPHGAALLAAPAFVYDIAKSTLHGAGLVIGGVQFSYLNIFGSSTLVADSVHTPLIIFDTDSNLPTAAGQGIVGCIAYRIAGIRPFNPPATYLNRVTSEHAFRPNFMATLGTLIKPISDVQKLVAQMSDVFDLDFAVGSQLDVVGQWIGQSRNLRTPLQIYFTLDDDTLGFDFGVWKGPFDPDQGLSSLADESYRKLLRAVAKANEWDGTVDGAYAAWEELNFNVLIQDTGQMSIVVALVGPLPDAVTMALFTGDYVRLRPAGVKIVDFLVETVADAPFFGFDIQNSNVAGFDSGAWGRSVVPPVFTLPQTGYLVQGLAGSGAVILNPIQIQLASAALSGVGDHITQDQIIERALAAAALVGSGAISTFLIKASAALAGAGAMPTNSLATKFGVALLTGSGVVIFIPTGALLIGAGAAVVAPTPLIDRQSAGETDGVGGIAVTAVVISISPAALGGGGTATAAAS